MAAVRPAAVPPTSPSDHDPGEDVRFSIEQTAEWIRGADTKTGLLGTAVAILVAAVSGKVHKAEFTLAFKSVHNSIEAAFLVAFLVCLFISSYQMVRVLVPRVQPGSSDSRYSWPWLANSSENQLRGLSAATSRSEAWVQAQTLAIICREKYKHFKCALMWALGCGLAFLGWAVALGWK